MPRTLSRTREISRLRRYLESFSYPRIQMMLIVALTGAAGFGVSYGLLQAGVARMPQRYVFATITAYGVFLILLWCWLRWRDDEGQIEMPQDSGSSHSGSSVDYSGHGGEYGGGGASGSFGDSPSVDSGFDVGNVADAEEMAIPLVVLAALAAALLSSLWIVYSAPTLFAELLVDGVLATSLYRRLRRMESRHWLDTAVRRTFIPFLATILALTLAAYIMQWLVPDAVTLGDVLSGLGK